MSFFGKKIDFFIGQKNNDFFWKKKCTDKKMDDFFGQRILIFMRKVKIRLRNQNLKKKFRLRRYLRIPAGF